MGGMSLPRSVLLGKQTAQQTGLGNRPVTAAVFCTAMPFALNTPEWAEVPLCICSYMSSATIVTTLIATMSPTVNPETMIMCVCGIDVQGVRHSRAGSAGEDFTKAVINADN